MPDNSPALVAVAAGGLGTRVHPWARCIPKEFYPVAGRPGITQLLEEIAALGPARVAIVHYPYYEQFAASWREGSHSRAGYPGPANFRPRVSTRPHGGCVRPGQPWPGTARATGLPG